MSPLMVNLKARVGTSNPFFKAFKQKDSKRAKYHICTDCLKKCWKKREFTSTLPERYENLPSYATLMNAIADVESESSQSQDTESAFSIKDENASDFNQIDDDSQEVSCDGLRHHEDDDDGIVANEIDANCGDDEDEESGVEELEKQEPRISCTLLRLKQQIFSWGLIPGPK
eukprot:gene14117-5111_t